ncbi:MAG: DNA integrity scanning protein DisA nucleotide-binding domain protein [Bacilli bacterium]|nr:DNA integrity scanning protein DisA nucleotide-binding domain protein [Bacilli bacterium]
MRRRFVRYGLIISQILFLVAWLFKLLVFEYVLLFVMTVLVLASLATNRTEYRSITQNSFQSGTFDLFRRGKKVNGEVLFDRDAVYNEVNNAVIFLSKSMTGAIITFMKRDNILADEKYGPVVTQRGFKVDAPLTAPLLETIFYKGTALHDGAVVVKDDRILRAAVFFKPTNTPMPGKFGSRHQAGLGISENSDAVTVVVSEENGGIIIAYQGELHHCNHATFLPKFTSLMLDLPKDETDKED